MEKFEFEAAIHGVKFKAPTQVGAPVRKELTEDQLAAAEKRRQEFFDMKKAEMNVHGIG